MGNLFCDCNNKIEVKWAVNTKKPLKGPVVDQLMDLEGRKQEIQLYLEMQEAERATQETNPSQDSAPNNNEKQLQQQDETIALESNDQSLLGEIDDYPEDLLNKTNESPMKILRMQSMQNFKLKRDETNQDDSFINNKAQITIESVAQGSSI